MKNDREYFAFISYQRKDEAIAKRLQHTLEYYKLPVAVIEKEPELKDGVRPIFVDMTELGDEPFLTEAIEKAMKGSRFLIVVCSPRSAKSKWVNKEVQYFIKLKRTKRIVPFIIEGVPNADVESEECCTPLMQKLLGKRELLGINVNEMGFDAAAVKVVSRMFRISFRSLWNRYEKDKEEEQRKIKEQNDRLQIAQSRFVAEKAINLAKTDSYLARRLAVEVLPKELDNPDRPYTSEADAALRFASYSNTMVLRGHTDAVWFARFSPDGKRVVSKSSDNHRIWDAETGLKYATIDGHFIGVDFYHDSNRIIQISIDKIDNNIVGVVEVKDLTTGKIVRLGYLNDFLLPHECYYNSDKDYAVTCCSRGMIELWDIPNCTLAKTFSGGNEECYTQGISINSKGTMIAACSDNHIRLWKTNNEEDKMLLQGHSDKVAAVDFSHNGKRLVSASWDKTLKIWDIDTMSELNTLKGHSERVFAVSYSTDGEKIVSGDEEGIIIIWDAIKEEIFRRFEGHTDAIHSVHFSPDGRKIVSASNDKTIRIWDVEENKELTECEGTRIKTRLFSPIAVSLSENKCAYAIENCLVISDLYTKSIIRAMCDHKGDIHTIAFSPNGSLIISGSADHSMLLWDVVTGKMIRPLIGHTDEVWSVSFSPNGKRIVSTSEDKTIKIWDVESGDCLLTKIVSSWMAAYNPTKEQVVYSTLDGKLVFCDSNSFETLYIAQTRETKCKLSFSLSPDGNHVVSSSSRDGVLELWDANTGKHIKNLIPPSLYPSIPKLPNAVKYNSDGSQIVSISGLSLLNVWDAYSGNLIYTFDPSKDLNNTTPWHDIWHITWALSVAFSSSGDEIISSSPDRTIVLDGTNKTVLHVFKKPVLQTIQKVSLSPNDNMLAMVWEDSMEPIIRNRVTGTILQALIGHKGAIKSMQFNTGGGLIVTTADDHTVRVWEVSSGKEINCLYKQQEYFDNALFIPENTSVVVSSKSKDKTTNFVICIWDYNNNKLVSSSDCHLGEISSIQVSMDGKYLISASIDGSIKIWDALNGKLKKTLKNENLIGLKFAMFDKANKTIISIGDDSTLKVWDIATEKIIKRIENISTIYSISPDGKYFSCRLDNNTIAIYDIESEMPLQTIKNPKFRYCHMSFSPHGDYIAIIDYYSIFIWDFPPIQKLINQTRERFKDRPLTREERRQYYLE